MTEHYRGSCCDACFSNEDIQEFIRDNGQQGNCPYCGSTDVYVADTLLVGDFIKAGIRRAYEVASYFAVKEEMCRPQSVYDILCEDECIFSDLLVEDEDLRPELLEELMDPMLSVRDIQHGDTTDEEFQDIYADTFILHNEIFGGELTAASNSWENFKYICRYFNRFFDISEEKRWREHILEKMDGIWRSLEKTLGTDGSWYRARTYEFDRIITQFELDCIDAYEAVGPAPYDCAKNNRMSPAGISYIYLSSSQETCAREIRALDGQHILVGRFRLKKALVLLDMTIENVESLSFDPGSIFSEEYDSDMIWIKGFLLQFAREISRPISEKDAELEYVPTQLLAEYIRKQGYAGIIFSSSLCPSERNVVLFYGPTKAPPCNFWDVVGSNVLQKYSDALTLDELSYEKVALIPSFSQCATRTSISEPAEDKSGTEFACPKG